MGSNWCCDRGALRVGAWFSGIAPIHTAQVISYLKATGHRLGLLINFNVPILKEGIKRVIPS